MAPRLRKRDHPASGLPWYKTYLMHSWIVVSLPAALLLIPAVVAQPVRMPSPADTVVSPEVHPDGRITFRLYAPHGEGSGAPWIGGR